MKKFEIAKWNEHQKFNDWFLYCSKNQIPYIIVKKKVKYANVEWDYINLDKSYDKTLVSNAEKNRELFLEIFKKYANRKSRYLMCNLLFTAENILIEDCKKLAEEIFDVVNVSIV